MTKKVIKAEIHQLPENYDTDDVIFVDEEGKEVGFGFRSKEDGTIKIKRCPECGRENYAMTVSSGFCAWCGYKYEEENEKESTH